MLTDMEVKLDNMRNSVYKNAWKLDRGCGDRLGVVLMKRYVPEAATEVASDAMQIVRRSRVHAKRARLVHDGQDCRGFQMAEGTDQIMVYIASPLIMEKYA